MQKSAGLKSLAVAYPPTIRTNDYWRKRYPEIVADAEKRSLAKLWSLNQEKDREPNIFEQEMRPYLEDTFRGAKERRVVKPGESALQYEVRAAKDALAAAGMEPKEVDVIISVSFWPDNPGFGNGPWLARELGVDCAAWNMETCCSGAMTSMQVGAALVKSGTHRNALVVNSCLYSRATETEDTLSWFLGDGAGAAVIGEVEEGRGILGSKTIHTAETIEAFVCEWWPDPVFRQRLHIEMSRGSGSLKKGSDEYLLTCCGGAAEQAGVKIGDIDFFIFNTPTAWFSSFATRALGVDPAKTVNGYPLYANNGPALTMGNLHLAARTGKLRPDDLVLVYSIGSVSTAGAFVMRWGDVKLGPAPEPGVPEE